MATHLKAVGYLKRMYRSVDAKSCSRKLTTRVFGVESGEIRNMYRPAEAMTSEFKSLYDDYLRELCGDPQIASVSNQVIDRMYI